MSAPSPLSWACAREAVQEMEGLTVGDAMLRRPQVLTPGALVSDLTAFFGDDHVHAALVVDARGRLVTVVEPADLLAQDPTLPAGAVGRMTGRTVPADAALLGVWRRMRWEERRRLAVVDGEGRLLGLLCLKQSGRGFCSDEDVESRRRARAAVRASR